MFNDSLLLLSGMEYSAKLPCGHVVQYLSKKTAATYRDEHGAEVIAPVQGPKIPECFKKFIKPSEHVIAA